MSVVQPQDQNSPASSAPRNNKSIQAQANPGPQPVSNPANSTPRSGGPKLEARGAGTTSKIPRGNAGARLGAYEQTNTNDLADFLRSSGPAEDSTPVRKFEPLPPAEPVKEKKRGFFSRFRKEKV